MNIFRNNNGINISSSNGVTIVNGKVYNGDINIVNGVIIGGKEIESNKTKINEKITLNTNDLTIDTSFTNVTIYQEDRENIEAHLHGEAMVTGKLQLEVKGNLVKVNSEGSIMGDVILDIYIPKNLKKLNFYSSSGDIFANKLNTIFEARTSSGNVRIRNLNGSIKAITSSGDVKADGIINGDTSIVTSSGDVTMNIRDTSFTVNVSTSSGDFDYDGIKVEKITKKVYMGIKGSGKYHINISTSSGDIEVNA